MMSANFKPKTPAASLGFLATARILLNVGVIGTSKVQILKICEKLFRGRYAYLTPKTLK